MVYMWINRNFAIVKIYKKVESKVKSRFYFVCHYILQLCAPLASLINLLLYYIILMVQPLPFLCLFL